MYIFWPARVISIWNLYFWSSGHPLIQGSGQPDSAKSWKKIGRLKKFWIIPKHLLLTFMANLRPWYVQTPKGLVRGQKKRGRERKRRESERKPRLCLVSFGAAEKNPWRTKGVLQSFKVFPWDFMLQSSSFMCWDINYVDSLFYFMKKFEAFEG